MRYIIYKALNTINSKSYIGLTTRTLQQRKYQHEWVADKRPRSYFHKSIARYGKDAWIWSVIEEGDSVDREFIRDRERLLIKENNTFGGGYNMTEGGEDFSSSEYQRWLQNRRVTDGTHPFLGGEMQRSSSTKRWQNGTNNLIGLNEKRIANGTHNFIGSTHPQVKRKQQGIKHHNQLNPWNNTKAKKEIWAIADQLYVWYIANHHKKRGGGPYKMAEHFDIKFSYVQKMYYEYFEKGWNPHLDKAWIRDFR